MNARRLPPASLGNLADKVLALPRSEAAKLINAADSAVEGLKDEILDTLAIEIARIEILLQAAQNKPRDNAAELRWLYDILFDAKALAGTFDYPLISQIGESLRCFLKQIDVAGRTKLTVIEHHVRAMSAVIRDDHRGDNDKVGHAVLASLSKIIETAQAPSAGQHGGEGA